MVDSIFTSQVPAGTFTDGAPGLTLGVAFKSDANGYVTHNRLYAPTPVPSQAVIGLLYQLVDESNGTELARVTYGALTPGAWNTAEYDDPIEITANVTYVTCWWTPENYVFLSGVLSAGALTNGHLTANQTGNPVANGRFLVNATPGFPTGNASGAVHFADLVFTTELAPPNEVSGVGLATLGALSAVAAGVRTVRGTAAATLGALSASAQGSGGTGEAGSDGSGWDGLLSIIREADREAAYQRTARPRACPNDGEPLQTGPRGDLNCPWGDYRWPDDQADAFF